MEGLLADGLGSRVRFDSRMLIVPFIANFPLKLGFFGCIVQEQFRRGQEQFRRGASAELPKPLRNDHKQGKILIYFYFFLQHYNRGFKAELTLKAVVGTVIKECFPRFTATQ
ncbi:hypothetical protein LXL04_015754 [Taraxacum kok-saghyz]